MVMKLSKTVALVAVIFVSPYCFAGEIVGADKYEKLEKRVKSLEEKVTEQGQYIKSQTASMEAQQQKIEDYETKLSKFEVNLHELPATAATIAEGLELGVGGTMLIQGTNNTNVNAAGTGKKESRTDASHSIDITVGKKFNDVNGRAFVHLESGQGAGLEDNLTLYSNVNRDADGDNNVRLTEFWYEQNLFKDKAAFSFGKLDPTAYFDTNDVANCETTQFLGRIFRNSPTIEFPDNTAGLRLAVLPLEWLELGYGVFDGNSDWENIGDNLFNIGQVTFKPKPFDLPGNYRFLGWNNNSDHTRWLDNSKQKENSYGFGLSFDQKVSDIVTLFTRYSWQDPKTYNPNIMATGDLNYSLETSWSAGFQVEGKPWGRENDILAFAIGEAIASGDYKDAGAGLDPARKAKHEGHSEAYYKFHMNDHLSISPDIQYIWNPFGKDVVDDTSPVFVYGLRSQIDF